MATNKQLVKSPTQMAVAVKRSRESIMADVCELLSEGKSLTATCKLVSDAKVQTVLDWVKNYPELAGQYTHARETGYALLADEIVSISDESCVEAKYDGEDIKLVLDSTAVARNRLRVDTRKWMLSKMLPKVYGDKVTQEHVGADGGAIKIAAMDFKGLSDAELEQMQQMMLKAAGTGS